MSTSATTSSPSGPHTQPPAPDASAHNAADFGTAPGRFHFMLRRVHSLMGLVLGGYIVVHLVVNATGLWPHDYQKNVNKIHDLEPMLPYIELAAVFTPLLIHALYGVYITLAGVKFNTTRYAYGGNIRYTLQRWTGVILLAFIAFHVGTLHKWGLKGVQNVVEWVHPLPAELPTTPTGELDVAQLDGLNRLALWCGYHGGRFTHEHNQAFVSTVTGIRYYFHYPEDVVQPGKLRLGNLAVMAFYLLGVWSAVFHVANGLWTSAIAWGLTVTAAAQRRWGHVCLAMGIALAVVGTLAWYAFTFAPAAKGDLLRWSEEPQARHELIIR